MSHWPPVLLSAGSHLCYKASLASLRCTQHNARCHEGIRPSGVLRATLKVLSLHFTEEEAETQGGEVTCPKS